MSSRSSTAKTVMAMNNRPHKPVIKNSCAAVFALLTIGVAASTFAADPAAPSAISAAAANEFFESKVRPLLIARCVECHGPKKEESGLRLDSRERVLAGNDEGPVVLLKQAGEEPAAKGSAPRGGDQDAPRRQAHGRTDCAHLSSGSSSALPWPNEKSSGALDPAETIAAKAKQHWAFQPVQCRRCRR